jgi:hypothetical protein
MRLKTALKEENLRAAFEFYDEVWIYKYSYRIKMDKSLYQN